MVAVYSDKRMLDHIPAPGHPERPERLRDVLRQLERTGLAATHPILPARPASDQELLLVHTQAHVGRIDRFARGGGGHIEIDTWMSDGSQLAARLAVGAAVDAVGRVVEGADRRALCLVRPPGHHARPGAAMGFCIYSSVAVAAAAAVERHGLGRVLIVDWDVHHGNGTQEAFYEDPRVTFLSVHRYPFYPGTGAKDETGSGRGLGSTRNLPLPYGIRRSEYHAAFRAALEAMADRCRPELVLVSAGFDAHAEDPIGDLGLEAEDFVTLTRDVLDVAATHAGGRLVSVLEGGYNVPILAGCVEAHLRTLAAADQGIPGAGGRR